MKQVRLRQTRRSGRVQWLLAVCLLSVGAANGHANNTAVAAGDRTVVAEVAPTSQGLEARIDSLYDHEEYLAAFALAVERLWLVVPPNDQNKDEFVDALKGVVTMASASGQGALASELAQLYLALSRELLGSNDVRLAAALRIQAGFLRTRAPEEAWRCLDEARCILESRGETETKDYERWLWTLGNWYRWRDNHAYLSYITRAAELREELTPEPSKDLADMYTWVGWANLQLGKHEEARRYLERARKMFVSLDLADNSGFGVTSNSLGDLAAINGDWKTAEAHYREATELAEINWRKNATFRSIPRSGYNLLAFTQVKQNKYDEAWRSLQRFRGGQATRASVGAASWRVRTDLEYERIRSIYDELLRDRASARAIDESPQVKPATWHALIDQLNLTARCARAETDFLVKRPVPETEIAQLQARLDEHTAYVGWLDTRFGDQLAASTGPFRTDRWMYVVRRTGPAQWVPIREVTTRAEDATMRPDAYRLIMTRAAGWRERLEDDPELARIAQRMYRNFFGVEAFELKGVDRLIVEFACYDEWVHADALMDPNGHYLSERYAVSYSPSAAVYVALADARASHRKKNALKVLAIGDPVFSVASVNDSSDVALATCLDDVTLRGAVNGERGALEKLPQLPYSGHEIDRLQALFSNCRALRGHDASEASVNRMIKKGQLDDFDIVHVATHALVDQTPERCAIALSRDGVDGSFSNDGLIDTPEIRMGWKLDAELVTLSACQTAGMQYSRGEPIGFAPALFQAGARCVLLSLWKVNDEATSLLMSRFYENVAGFSKQRKPVSYSDALADARTWLRNYRDQKGNRPFAHPVYWSGFVLIGDAH